MAGLLWRSPFQAKSLNLLRYLQTQKFFSREISHFTQSADGVTLSTCAQCSQIRTLSSLTKKQAIPSLASHHAITQQRNHAGALPRETIFSRIAERFGFKGKLRYPSRELQRSGIRVYLCAAELVEYNDFFEEFHDQLPDTFNSWFRITELHMWMCIVRLSSEGREGFIIRNNMMKNLWEDVDKRSKKLGEMAASSERREGINQLSQQLRASLYSYDEGILSDDRVLAGAVWRNFFEMKCEDPVCIEKLVHYIRKQMCHLDNQDSDMILKNGLITFLPLNGDKVNMERSKPILNEILNRT